MWSWLFRGQFTRAEELIVAVITLFAGLYLEDAIDEWRRKRNAR